MSNFIDESKYKELLVLNGNTVEADIAYGVDIGLKKTNNIFHDRYIVLDYGYDTKKYIIVEHLVKMLEKE